MKANVTIESVNCYKDTEHNPDFSTLTQEPLFGFWRVNVTHTAYCGHPSCGLDWSDYRFMTGKEALEFINSLSKGLP